MVKFMKSVKSSLKRIVLVFVATVILATSTISFARDEMDIDTAKYVIQHHIEKDSWDFVGMKGEKIYFYLRDEYAKGDKLKELEFDLRMLKEDFNLSRKAIDDNSLIYAGLISVGGLGYYANHRNISSKKKQDIVFRILKQMTKF